MRDIVVLMGGTSSEKDVSIVTGTSVFNALKNCNFIKQNNIKVTTYTLTNNINQFCNFLHNNPNIVIFNALHGVNGEDGRIQAVLDLYQIPYTYSGVVTSAVAMNKLISKEIAKACNMFVAKHSKVCPSSLNVNNLPINYPFVLKPIQDGSSSNVFIINNATDLQHAIKQVSHLPFVMLEEYINGYECTVGVLDGNVLGVTEIIPLNNFYDYNAKYKANQSKHLIPPKHVSSQAITKMKNFSANLCNVLSINGAARVDFIVNHNMVPYFLEINTQPGLTPTSLLPEQAQECGIDYAELCLRILASAKYNL